MSGLSQWSWSKAYSLPLLLQIDWPGISDVGFCIVLGKSWSESISIQNAIQRFQQLMEHSIFSLDRSASYIQRSDFCEPGKPLCMDSVTLYFRILNFSCTHLHGIRAYLYFQLRESFSLMKVNRIGMTLLCFIFYAHVCCKNFILPRCHA